MAKQKFYVVWRGVNPGIYRSWEDCKLNVAGVENAQYKSFATLKEAEEAFAGNPWKYLNTAKTNNKPEQPTSEIIKESLAVDAACSGNPGKMEYRGVFVADGVEIFHSKVYEDGTNNIGEFLAIVHALAMLKQKNSNIPIYTDSSTALTWVKKKKCNTKLERMPSNQPIFELIARAEAWLATNSYNTNIIKWNTEAWGEIPADFGRK